MMKSAIHGLFAAILFVLCLSAEGLCSGPVEFRAAELSRWTPQETTSVALVGGTIRLSGLTMARIISPAGLGIEPRGFVSVRLLTRNDNYGFIILGLADGRRVSKRLRLRGSHDLSEGLREHSVYIGDIIGPSDRIEGVALSITGSREIEADVASIRLFDPTFLERAGIYWKGLWEPDFIDTWTISFVTTPTIANTPLPPIIVLASLLAAFIIILAVYIRQRTIKSGAAIRIVMGSLIAGWIALSVRMDYNWLVILGQEFTDLYGKEESERIKEVNNRDINEFVYFTAYMKSVVPADKKISAAFRKKGNPLETLVAYYALPIITSRDPDIVWVYGISGLEFDPSSGTLSMNGEQLPYRVRLYAQYGDAAALFEVITR